MGKITPALLQSRMDNPGGFRQALLRYLEANKAKVDVSKSIGELEIYDQQTVAAITDLDFFTGAVAANRTNLQNSFTRPEAEHMIVIGIRLSDGTNANVQDTDWVDGLSLAATKNATFTVSTNGVTYLRNFPALAASDEKTDDTRGIIYLTEPIVWLGQTAMDVKFKFPTAPAANENLRVSLIGVGTLS